MILHFQLERVRGASVQHEASKTNLTSGLHVGYFLVDALSLGAELHYQRWIDAPFGVESIERDGCSASASFQRPIVLAAMRKEVGAGGAKERSESPSIRVGRGQIASCDQIGEEVLDQVGAVFRSKPSMADKAVERIPVVAA